MKHLFCYGLKSMFRAKEVVFWTFIFPFALSTLMYFAFGNINEMTEQIDAVPVAVVEEKENPALSQTLEELSKEGKDQLLTVTETTREKADAMLQKEEVKGILVVADELKLVVAESGIEQSVLEMVVNQFVQYEKTITDIAAKNPQNVAKVVESMTEEANYLVDKSNKEGNQDNLINYFYAIFAMTCLFASYAGVDKTIKMQANVSALGQRRSVAPTSKGKVIVAEFLASELVQFTTACLVFVYMKFVLGIDFGSKYPAILLLLFVGTSFGIMLGVLVGNLPRLGESGKIGILTGVSLGLSAMSDLMAAGIKDFFEHHAPIINDINPAALICDSFYALNIYDNYQRFAQNMIILGGMTVACGIVSFVLMRRNRYASL